MAMRIGMGKGMREGETTGYDELSRDDMERRISKPKPPKRGKPFDFPPSSLVPMG
jgi:hypothetical protein